MRNGYVSISDPKYYGIEVLSPTDDEQIGNTFSVIGTYKKLPKNHSIWVSTFVGDGKSRVYWPQKRADIDYDGKKGTWRSRVNWISGSKGEPRRFLIIVVGQDGDALFDYFKKAGRENTRTVKEKTGQELELWPGIAELTSDSVECLTVRIRI